MPPTPFANLADALAPVIAQSEALRVDVHAAERARRTASWINIGLLVLMAFGLALVLAVGCQSNRVANQVARTNATITDCTVPGGACYAAGNARTGHAISDVIHAQVLVSECSRQWPGEVGPAYDAKLEACVAGRLGRPVQPVPQPSAGPSAAPSAVPRPAGTR